MNDIILVMWGSIGDGIYLEIYGHFEAILSRGKSDNERLCALESYFG